MNKSKVIKVNKNSSVHRHCPSWQPQITQNPNTYIRKQAGGNSGDFRNVQQYGMARPDPSAPHLKYGLFNKKRSNAGLRYNPQPGHIYRQTVNNCSKHDNHNKKEKKYATKTIRSGLMAKSTAFIYPSTQRQFEHHLSLSRVKHIDIKPRYMANAPMFHHPMPFQLISDVKAS